MRALKERLQLAKQGKDLDNLVHDENYEVRMAVAEHERDEDLDILVKNEVVPIAFVAKQTSNNPGAKTLDTQEREKPKEEKPKSEPKIEKKVEEKKVEEKKPVEKPIEKKAEKTEEKKIESNIPSKNEPSHSDTSSKLNVLLIALKDNFSSSTLFKSSTNNSPPAFREIKLSSSLSY